MSTRPEVDLTGSRQRNDEEKEELAQAEPNLDVADAVPPRRQELELTNERRQCLRLAGEQGGLAADQLAELLDLPIADTLRLAYELKRQAWIGTEELIPKRYPWVWLRDPGARRIGLGLEGGRPHIAELLYLWAANEARIYFFEEIPDGRWVGKEFLRRDYCVTRGAHVPAGIVEVDDDDGFIRRHAVEVRWSAGGSDSEPDLNYIQEILGEHMDRYETVDYFCPEHAYRLLSEAGFDPPGETLTIHKLRRPAQPNLEGVGGLLSQLATQVTADLHGKRGNDRNGRRQAVVVKDPAVVYRIELAELPVEALHKIAEVVGMSRLPQPSAAWKKQGAGNHLYCVVTDVGVFRVTFSGWGWGAAEVVDKGVFEKRVAPPPPKPRKFHSRGEQEISDGLWAKIAPLLPTQNGNWANKYPHRLALAGIICLLRNRMRSWKDLTLDLGFGSGSRCHRRLRHWEKLGVWDAVEEILRKELPDGEELDWSRLKLSKGRKHRSKD